MTRKDAWLRGLQKLRRGISSNRASLIKSYQSEEGIVLFVREVLGANPAHYQEEILRLFYRHRRISVRAGHGVGKSAVAAWCALYVFACFDMETKIPCTASVWRQLTKYLFPELKKWVIRADWSLVGLEDLITANTLNISAPHGEIFAVASKKPDYIEGAHADNLMYVLDESKAIPDGIWDAVEGAFTTPNVWVIAISTPGDPVGRFYDIHKRKKGTENWYVYHVAIEQAIEAKLVTQKSVDDKRALWGETSPVYINRVLGNFAENIMNVVIPLSWVEMANERWIECKGYGRGNYYIGVDPSTSGMDMTAIAVLHGDVVERIDYTQFDNPMATAGRVVLLLDEIFGDDTAKFEVPIGIDANGVGSGVYYRLMELGYNVVSVMAGEKAQYQDFSGTLEFLNTRSFMWWHGRDLLNPQYTPVLALPDDDRLTGDLTTPTWKVNSRGAIQIESKDDIAQRLGGRSTDAGDAVLQALYAKLAGRLQFWDL